jgi:hypothetical protein
VHGNVYTIEVTSVNHKPFSKIISPNGTQTLFTLVIESEEKTLDNVVVSSKRPLMRQLDDKTIIDPENIAASSTNAYEIFEKTPGLFVDHNGNVYLSSTTPALIYINGRELKMSAADVATLLKKLTSQFYCDHRSNANTICKIRCLRKWGNCKCNFKKRCKNWVYRKRKCRL